MPHGSAATAEYIMKKAWMKPARKKMTEKPTVPVEDQR